MSAVSLPPRQLPHSLLRLTTSLMKRPLSPGGTILSPLKQVSTSSVRSCGPNTRQLLSVIYVCGERETDTHLPSSGAFGGLNNQIDIRQINKRK